MNHKFSKTILSLTILAVILLVAASTATWKAAAQEPLPSPFFRAHPVWDSVDGWYWTLGSTLTLTIDDPSTDTSPDLMMDMMVTEDPTGSTWFNFSGTYDLKPGDLVTMTDGNTTRSLVVSILTIKDVDVDADTMMGVVEPDAQVRLPVPSELIVVADSSGYWTANFYEIGIDLQPGTTFIAEYFDEDGDQTSFEWYIPNPHFAVFPEWEWFDGMDWPDGATVVITVGDKEQCATSKESWGGFFNGGFEEGCDVAIDDVVTFTDGSTIRTHTVQNLGITKVDKTANTVTGIADDGASVHAWIHELGGDLYLQAVDGYWVADFGQAGIDLQELMSGRVEILDEQGNATAVDWSIPNPHFTVFPEWEWFDGMDWPDGANVTITVKDKPQCETSKESWGNFFNGSFGEGCNIEFGDVVTFSDGETTRTHTVRNLAVTKVNPEDDLIKGTADAGVEIHVWPHATGQDVLVTTNPQGKWNAEFAGIYDLMRGDGGRASIRDETGNATEVEWYIPRPILTIYPDAQWFDGNDFPDGATVEVTVAGKPECDLEIESWGGFFGGNFPEGCFVTTGDLVKYKQGSTTLTHTVRNLTIKIIDKDANTVRGEADPGEIVNVWAWYMADGSTVDGSNTEVTTDENGTWFVDYGDLDLVNGMGIQALIRDSEGNQTSVDLAVPNTHIVASIPEDWFYLVDFLPGETLNFAIYQSQGGALVWEGTVTADVNGFAWINPEERWILEPGNYLVVSDGRTTKELTIEAFTFDVFDTTLGRLQGTAPAPFGRTVLAGFGWEGGGWSEEVHTDLEDGSWLADYGGPVPGYSWVYAQIFDEDGDASELRPDRVIGP